MTRRSLVVLAAACVVALLASASIDRDAASQRAVSGRLATVLVELGMLAGLRDDSGEVTLRPLPVAANLEGGPLWLRGELEAAIEADPAFELTDSPNLIRVEVVGTDVAYGLAASLYRQGWNLRAPHPVRVRIAPWVTTVSAVFGVLVAFAIGRIGWGLAAAGTAAQVAVSALPWQAPLTPASWSVAVREGPVGVAVLGVAKALPDASLAIGIGIVVLCGLLVYFDHRRAPKRGGTLMLSGLAGAAGLLLWIEASARAGVVGWGGTGAGAVALVVLVGAFAYLARSRRSA